MDAGQKSEISTSAYNLRSMVGRNAGPVKKMAVPVIRGALLHLQRSVDKTPIGAILASNRDFRFQN